MKEGGFSLLEVLVAIAISSIVMVAIIQLQSGTIQTTTNVMTSSDRLRDQTSAISYIADRFRGARVLYDTASTPITLNATTTCSNATTSTTPCVAFLSSETTWDPTDASYASGAVKRYVLLAYRYQVRTTFADRQSDPWADASANNVQVIMEYRRELKSLDTTCPDKGSCPLAALTTAAATAPSATTGLWTSAMLSDGLTLDDPVTAGSSFRPWTLDTAGGSLTIRIRSVFAQSGAKKYFPGSRVTTMQVLKRN